MEVKGKIDKPNIPVDKEGGEIVPPSLERHPSQAVILFLQASEYERAGNIGRAIKLYEKAFRLDPDVDKQVGTCHINIAVGLAIVSDREGEQLESLAAIRKPIFSPLVPGLLEALELTLANESSLSSSSYSPNNNNNNLLGLPFEVLVRILEWVGIRHCVSLEKCAQTCAAMYVATRSHRIWKRLTRISGIFNLAPSLRSTPPRQAFFMKPRLRTDGVYICKISYYRPGLTEGTFFQTIHLVTYYRYLRFFGPLEQRSVMLLVTTEEPTQVLDTLRNSPSKTLDSILLPRVGAIDLLSSIVAKKHSFDQPNIPNTLSKANLFIGRYSLVEETDQNNINNTNNGLEYCLTLLDPYSSHRQTTFEMNIALSGRKSIICKRYSSYSPARRSNDEPSRYDFKTEEWGKFIFSRVKSFIS